MYYYIMDSPKNSSQKREQEKIKDALGFLGIAGETVTVSPARTVEELTNMGLAKKYSTIVAVGGDRLVNKIAAMLQEKDHVLGVIPLDASAEICNLIGTNNVKTACENLRFRKVKNVDLSYIEPNKYFLTNINIISSKPLNCQIEVDSCDFKATATSIILEPDLTLNLQDTSLAGGAFKKAFNWLFGQKTEDKNTSIFKGKRIKIDTSESLPVLVDSEVIAKTPIVVRVKPKVLKIISGRDKIEANNK